jgi:fructokinase
MQHFPLYRLGIDMGGTKTEVILLNTLGETIFRHRLPTPTSPSSTQSATAQNKIYHQWIDTILDLVGMAIAQGNDASAHYRVGIGSPGTLNSQGYIKNANTTCLNGRALLDDISRALGQRFGKAISNVALANDANCFALSEATDGAGQIAGCTPEVVFGVILGTGVGGGLVVNGKIVQGANGIAGEWGHSPLPWADEEESPGNICYCGKQGCVESWLSGPALSEDHGRHTGERKAARDIVQSVHSLHGNTLPFPLTAVGHGLKIGEEAKTMLRYEKRLAKALAAVINVLDPHIIVLGGGLSNLPWLYDRVPAWWPQFVFSDTINTRLRAPRHGDSSGVRGAAWL